MSSTGSHLRGAPAGAGGGGAGGSVSTTTSTTNLVVHEADHCTHDHSHAHHSHSHSHSHDDVEMTTQQLLQLQKQQQIHVQLPSVQDLLSDDTPPQELFKAFTTLLRFGRFEALQPVIEGLLLRPFAEDTSQSLSSSVIFKTLLQSHDEGGHSLLHWAAKRGDDLRFLQTFLELASTLELLPSASTSSSSNNTSNKQPTSIVNTPSQDNVGMTPLHWACTEASIPHVALLLTKGHADIEAKDSSGCTPLLIAAQYGQVEVVAFLLQKGAQLMAVDKSGDTALHWASYKGSIPVCGLLGYYDNALTFAMVDQYGQTPLHLAALRGHTTVVRYILRQLGTKTNTKNGKSTTFSSSSTLSDVLFLKDKNGRTPLDLAIHKNRPNVQIVLKEQMAALEDPRGHFFRQTLWTQLIDFFRPSQWRQWLLTGVGLDEVDKPMKAPFYFLVGNFGLHCWIVFTCFIPLWNAEAGLLWDQTGWIFLNLVLMVLTWYTFIKTWRTAPGYVDSSHDHFHIWQQQYEATLEQYAHVMDRTAMDQLPQLCHSCHVARPFRSKHCKIARKCVLVFDHYCPFVDNTVGLYNYKYFLVFLLLLTSSLLAFALTMIMYLSRYRAEHSSLPWMTIVATVEICLCLFPAGGLTAYHIQLSTANLTTNEHINIKRYKYFWRSNPNPMSHQGDGNGKSHGSSVTFHNPWNKGSWGNLMDRLFPSDACYMIPEEQRSLQSSSDGVDSTF